MSNSKYQNSIKVIITGGTIDSLYDGKKDAIVPLAKSGLPSFFDLLQLEDNISFVQVCMKDSRALTSIDLKNILKTVLSTKENLILITHGTYTMPDTARFLKANLTKNNKVIVFTGAMIPLSGFSPSDAPFNLGYSIASLKTLAPGVYVCMNGKIFTPEEVVKRLAEGRFVSIFSK